MNETQILIKTSIENETKQQLGVDVIVEYVPNISLRKQELQKQAGEKFNSVYNADHFTGTFIPAIGNNPYYILVQENRESMLDIMTAFHEYKHLIDYVLFFKVVCDNDIELLKKSPMYITFNVYSEYSATRFGVKKYIETVNFEDMNQKELAESILEIAKEEYRNLQGVKNRYQLLVHSMQYLGNIMGCIAIREGVKKSFDITADHFMEYYHKKIRPFVYNSSRLNELDNFSSSSGINVMIINTQAFAASLKEGGRSKESRIIYSKRDEFASRRPIDVIKANRPIIILDEPQKMGGDVTQKALKNFNPLFTLNYSATHKKQHNLIYVLDALDAFNKKLVKKIEVKGFEVKNFRGTDSYLYLEQIVLSSKKPPMAKIELEIGYNKSINREPRTLGVGDDLYYISQEMEGTVFYDR